MDGTGASEGDSGLSCVSGISLSLSLSLSAIFISRNCRSKASTYEDQTSTCNYDRKGETQKDNPRPRGKTSHIPHHAVQKLNLSR